MRKDLDLKTAINVFAECLGCSPEEFEPHDHVVSCGYYPHAVELRKKLINEEFTCHEVGINTNDGPTSVPQIDCYFKVVIPTYYHLKKLESILNSGIYFLTEY